jgi:transposase
MTPDANDVRRALVSAYENHAYAQRAVAVLLGVSPASGRNILRRKRDTGPPEAQPRGGGTTATLPQPVRDRVRHLLARRPELTVAALGAQNARESQTRVSVPTMCRVVQRLGWRRKKRRVTPRNRTRLASGQRGCCMQRHSPQATSSG